MSEMERNKGKLTPVTMTEEIAKKICLEELGMSELEADYFDTWIECLLDTDKYVNIKGLGICRVEFEVRRDTHYGGFSEVEKNDDGSFSFHTYHYNGGAHYTEMIESGLKAKNLLPESRGKFVRPKNHQCKTSTGICDSTTFGFGELDEYGYWEHPCEECARAWEKQFNEPHNSCWPRSET